VVATTFSFLAHRSGIRRVRIFDATGRKITLKYYAELFGHA
jgi:hypothetical protein